MNTESGRLIRVTRADEEPVFGRRQHFGCAKLIGPIRQVMVRCIKKVDQIFVLTMAVYNLVRMRALGQVRQAVG